MSNQVWSNPGELNPMIGSNILVNGHPLSYYLNQPVRSDSSPSFKSPVLTTGTSTETITILANSAGTSGISYSDGINTSTMEFANLSRNQVVTIPNNTGTLVMGATSSTNGDLVSYNGTTGVIQDSLIPSSYINQSVATSSSPSFQNLNLAINGGIIYNSNAGNNTTLSFTPPTTQQVLTFPNRTATICCTTGGTSTNGNLATWFGTDESIITDSGIGSSSLVTLTGTQTLTNKTLTSPIISTISNSGTLTLSTTTGVIPSGPSTTTSGDLISYNSTNGQIIQDSGLASSNINTLSGTQTITGTKTFTNGVTVSAGKLNIVDPSDNTKQIQFLDSSATTGAVLTLSNALTSSQTVTFPNATDTLVGRATTDTLTNKSLSNANCFFIDPTTTTKKIGFQTSGATASTTLTIVSNQTTSKNLSCPNLTVNDTIATLNVNNIWNGTQSFGANCAFNSTVTLPDDTSLTIANINDATKTMAISLDGSTTGIKTTLATSSTSARTLTFPDTTSTIAVLGGLSTQTFTPVNTGLWIPTVINVTSVTTLTSTQYGSLVTIANAGSAYNINLPALASGSKFIFYIKSTLNAAVTIVAPSACIFGSVLASNFLAVTGGAITSAKTNVILGTSAVVGDRYEFYSDGSHYFLMGITALNTSVTFS